MRYTNRRVFLGGDVSTPEVIVEELLSWVLDLDARE